MRTLLSATVVSAMLVLTLTPLGPAAEPVALSPQEVESAVAHALPLLLKGATGHTAQKSCFACHNQIFPMLAFTTARAHGFAIQDEVLRAQREHIAAFLEQNRDNYREGKGQGGQADTAGYALLTLELAGWQADATTEAVVEYLLLRDKNLDHWRTTSNRPPSEASDFTVTYLALRALVRWGTPPQRARISKRIESAREWLLRAKPKDTEDRVFRLWALSLADASSAAVQAAAQDLLRTQGKDGGWAQTEKLASDAYATGSVLVVLQQTGVLRSTDRAYQRGLAFLLREQRNDGSWLIQSRSKPFQPYYESGFPHGKNQFISITASAWATTALALGCSPSTP